MTVPRTNAMVRFWQEQCPPVHRSMAASIGFKPKAANSTTHMEPEEQEQAAEAFFKMFPQRRGAPPAWATRNKDLLGELNG
jgi:hypothetical protein